jgi:HNH endonuclease
MPPPKPLPPISTLREYFHYNPDNGHLTWKVSKGGAQCGNVVNASAGGGHKQVVVNRQKCYLHRIAWVMYYGKGPGDLDVDHINGQPGDNRIKNLRLVTRSENQANRKLNNDNKSGVRSVTRNKNSKKWRAEIKFRGKQYARHYEDKTHAIAACCLAEYRLFGDNSSYFSRTPTPFSVSVESDTTQPQLNNLNSLLEKVRQFCLERRFTRRS